ncbi:putative L-xylulose 5-phosphate 3-epimerase [Citrobacter koseri]|uniref:Putative L-xylulose 5-phosphate 3-epimerase n=1 Tax=Citrobacter koseri TaxID=545 RepID=A0A2X2WI41_CITKO|nr:putative L-xylulose 5-phosphate 3-epimerase [Citrobacter koseri]
MRNHPLGIYEKALAKDLSWPERLVLAKSCGFDFVEMSVDETDERLSRLDWSPHAAGVAGDRHAGNRRGHPVNVPVRASVAFPSAVAMRPYASGRATS